VSACDLWMDGWMDDAGMNKMVVNHLGKLFVTHDSSTILHELEVSHPAAKLIQIAAENQEAEVCLPCVTCRSFEKDGNEV
jgi:hypothetical protein